MFGYALLVFVLLAAVAAVALFFAFKSGEQGKSKLSGFAGCWIALALLVVAFLGAIGLVVVAIANAPNEIVKHGPVKSFELQWDSDGDEDGLEPGEKRPAKPLVPRENRSGPRLVIDLKSSEGAAEIVRWIRDNVEGDLAIASEEVEVDGERRARVTLHLKLAPGERAELEEVKRELERELPNLRIPDGVKVELRDADE